MSNPYLLDTPAVVNFSGGRTSGLMLFRIIQAFGGVLPPGVLVGFQNTGKERPETLEFVAECGRRWGVPVVWLEYRRDPSKPLVVMGGNGQPAVGQHGFEVVTFETASGDGRPFDELLDVMAAFRREAKDAGPVLPNPVQRLCSGEMKVRTAARYLLSLGWDLDAAIAATGLRADEPKRVAKMAARNARRREPLECGYEVAPLAAAGVTEAEVMAFWAGQPFDLRLMQHEGNCDLCFLKRVGKRRDIMRRRPEFAAWWVGKEEWAGQQFRRDEHPYRRQLQLAQEMLPFGDPDDADLEAVACHCTD